MSRKKLGNLIRSLRKKNGMSLRKLAEHVDVSFVNIAHIENGRISTSENIIKQIAIALEYDPDRLLALADQVDNELETIIKNMPDAVPAFLRTAKNLTKDEWNQLTKQVEKMKVKK